LIRQLKDMNPPLCKLWLIYPIDDKQLRLNTYGKRRRFIEPKKPEILSTSGFLA